MTVNVGELVAIAEEVGGVLTKVPALVTKVYNNVHGEVVADLHKLATNVEGLVVKEANPPEALAEGAQHVTTDLTPPPEAPPASTAVDADKARIAQLEADLAAANAQLGKDEGTSGDGSPQ